MTLNRRTFVLGGTGSASIGFTGCAVAGERTISTIHQIIPENNPTSNPEVILEENIINTPDIKESFEFQRSLIYTTWVEMDTILSFFQIQDIESYKNQIGAIQVLNNLTKDYIVGPQTLKAIYTDYFFHDTLGIFPLEVIKRREAMEYAAQYINKKRIVGERTIRPTSLLDPFGSDFFGENLGFNVPETYANAQLLQDLQQINFSIKGKQDGIYIEQFQGKFMLYVIVNGELGILTYTSPGGIHKDPKRGIDRLYPTPDERAFLVKRLSKFHISSSYPKPKNKSQGGAIMPLAIQFYGPYYIHVGRVTGEEESHGCVRVPYFYQQALYKLIEEKGEEYFDVHIGKLYA